MSTRITNNQVYDRYLLNLMTNLGAVQKEQEKITTGRRINRPSDDPLGAASARRLLGEISRTGQLQENLASAETLLVEAESSVSGASEIATRAHEIAVQFANGTYSAVERAAGAKEVIELREELARLANRDLGGRYVFSGYRTDVPAYARTLVVSTGVNDELVVDTGSGDTTVTLASGIYTPEALARELESKLEAAAASADYDVRFDTARERFVIENGASNADSLDIKWEDSGSTAASTLGFSATDHAALAPGDSVSGENAVSYSQGFVVSASNNTIVADLDDDGTTESVTLTANAYTPAALAAEIQTRLNAADPDSGDSYSVSWNGTDGTFSITASASNASDAVFHWTDGGSTAASMLGFSADVTLAPGDSSESDTRADLSAYYMYQGDSGTPELEVADGVALAVGLPGDQVFDDLFAVLDDLVSALEADAQDEVSQGTTATAEAQETLLSALATLGARLGRVDAEKSRGADVELLLREELSRVRDADVIEAVVEMSRRQSALESLRYAGFQTLNQSLFDFLR